MPDQETPLLHPARAIQEMRIGNVEPVADYLERGAVDILFLHMTQEDRERIAMALRTGSVLTRSEKRQNSEACRVRDLLLMNSLFYWFGRGASGFSHTAENTAFHRALEDYEKNQIKGAPLRTAESLYRHVWKPYLHRIDNNELTDDDICGCQRPPLGSFIFGLTSSGPLPMSKLSERLQWFERVMLRPGTTFYLSFSDKVLLRKILNSAGLSADRWSKHVREQTPDRTPLIIEFEH